MNNMSSDFRMLPDMLQYRPKGIRALFIADTHGFVSEPVQEALGKDYDIVVFLGDHGGELEDMVYLAGQHPCYGLLGNHDEKDLYNYHRKIKHIGNRVTDIQGIKVAAFDGGPRYSESVRRCQYTQEEVEKLALTMPAADICISHSNPYNEASLDMAHRGFKGISTYLEEFSIPLHIYGHMHTASETVLPWKTKSICVFPYAIIEI